jgi:hypothetical protein
MLVKLRNLIFILEQETLPCQPINHDADEMDFIVNHARDEVKDVWSDYFTLFNECQHDGDGQSEVNYR